tara:strand:- start:2176 stop:2655 length:480 start_codon:yes stop_codon:yes gene_type:complete
MHKGNNEDFRQRWRESHKVVELIAMALLRKGCWVQILPQELTPSFEKRHKYADNGDLKIIMQGREEVCEVKGSGYEFKNGMHPFPTAFLCNKWSFDKADPKPRYYFIVCKSRTAVAIFDAKKDRKHMKVIEVTDKKRPSHETYQAYCVDSKLLRYGKLS